MQRELTWGLALEVGYIGSRSSHLQPSPTGNRNMNINQLPGNYLSMGSALASAVANPFFGHGGTGVLDAETGEPRGAAWPQP